MHVYIHVNYLKIEKKKDAYLSKMKNKLIYRYAFACVEDIY